MLGALAIAEQVANHFKALGKKTIRDLQVAPFYTDGWETDAIPYLYSRDPISSVSTFDDRCVKGRATQWNKNLSLGYAVGVLSHSAACVSGCLESLEDSVDESQASELGSLLVARVKADHIVTEGEQEFLERIQIAFRCRLESMCVGDFREKIVMKRGMRVYVSGGPGRSGSDLEGLRKDDIKEMCGHADLIFESEFQKQTHIDVLAIADPSNVTGGSYKKAGRWGIPVISWEELVEWAQSLP